MVRREMLGDGERVSSAGTPARFGRCAFGPTWLSRSSKNNCGRKAARQRGSVRTYAQRYDLTPFASRDERRPASPRGCLCGSAPLRPCEQDDRPTAEQGTRRGRPAPGLRPGHRRSCWSTHVADCVGEPALLPTAGTSRRAHTASHQGQDWSGSFRPCSAPGDHI
jgi:hypothetical protein